MPKDWLKQLQEILASHMQHGDFGERAILAHEGQTRELELAGQNMLDAREQAESRAYDPSALSNTFNGDEYEYDWRSPERREPEREMCR